jgi:ABC-type transport system involved in multi-copper enzyme maturation permease subunit
MQGLLRAEWRKMMGNRWMAGCFIWLWPCAALGISLLVLLIVALDSGTRQNLSENPYRWTDASLFFWAIPNSIIGRILIIGFTAALFAGEYQWGTWKNLLQRRGRVALILAKFGALGGFIVFAFSLTSLIWVLGMGLVQLVAGGGYPPALTQIPSDYWRDLAMQVSVAFLSTLIIAAIAALIALATRSVLASVIGGLFAAFIDSFVGAALILFYALTEWRIAPNLYRYTISYNVDNLLNWANAGQASPVLGNLPQQEYPLLGTLYLNPPLLGNHYAVSYLILGIWAALLVGAALYSFYRQDIT